MFALNVKARQCTNQGGVYDIALYYGIPCGRQTLDTNWWPNQKTIIAKPYFFCQCRYFMFIYLKCILKLPNLVLALVFCVLWRAAHKQRTILVWISGWYKFVRMEDACYFFPIERKRKSAIIKCSKKKLHHSRVCQRDFERAAETTQNFISVNNNDVSTSICNSSI